MYLTAIAARLSYREYFVKIGRTATSDVGAPETGALGRQRDERDLAEGLTDRRRDRTV
jgi:hypothetical protein